MVLIGITLPGSFISLHMANFKLPCQPKRENQVPLNVLDILTVQNEEQGRSFEN